MVLGDDCDDGAVLLEGRPRLGLALPQLGIIRVMFIVIWGPRWAMIGKNNERVHAIRMPGYN